MRIKKFIIIFSLAIVLFVAISAGLSVYERGHRYPHQTELNGTVLDIQVAVTDEEKELGLSGFSTLSENQGMLFIFDAPGRYGFWMKDMHFPIDIIWLDRDLTVVHVERSVSPDTYPNVFTPDADASYVLETASGFSEKNNLKEGDRADFSY